MNKAKIGVIGAGTMGNGIAHVFSLYGHSVILCDINKTILDKAFETININMQRQYSKGIIDKQKMKDSIKNLNGTININNTNLKEETCSSCHGVGGDWGDIRGRLAAD